MTIKEVSEMFDLSADTLRYYEKIGLIDNVERTAGGIRNYQDKDLKRIKFIKCMRTSGLSIEMLKRYLDLVEQGDDTLLKRKDILLRQREEILKQMKDLEDTLEHLNYKIENYDSILIKKIAIE